MANELATVPHDRSAHVPVVVRADVLATFLAGRNPRTLAAYSKDISDFAKFVGTPSAGDAAELLLSLANGDANALALGYRAHMVDRGLKAATIGRRLAALRSLVKLARTLGRIVWTLDVESPKAEPYRDTTGPGDVGWRSMLDVAKRAAETGEPKGLRYLALLRLLHDLGLRRGEAVALDLVDLDLIEGTVSVVGKGRSGAVRLTLPNPTRDALAHWTEARGSESGPLFVRLDRAAARPTRLTGTAVFKIIRDLGQRAGLGRPTRPHALRHQAITQALDVTNGDVRTVQQFSRHADPRTLLRYDDRRKDVAGDVARLVAGD
jgi:integrase/recombinase XerC